MLFLKLVQLRWQDWADMIGGTVFETEIVVAIDSGIIVSMS